MNTRQLLALVGLFAAVLLLSSAQLHNERVGEITFEQYQNQVYARAILDKRYLTLALKQEVDCPAAIMLSSCAPSFVQERMRVEVNGQSASLEKIDQELTQRHLIITWKLHSNDQQINSLELNSSYMLAYTDHATIGVNCFLNQQERYYTMSARKTAININWETAKP